MKKEIVLDHLFKKVMLVGAAVSGAVLIISAVCLIVDVFLRFVAHSSITGSKELVAMLMTWIAYFAIAYTLMERSHIQMTSFVDKLKGKQMYLNQFIVYLICTVFFIFLSKVGFEVFWTSFLKKEISTSAMTIYIWIGKLPIFVGSVLTVLQSTVMCIGAGINMVRSFGKQLEESAGSTKNVEEGKEV